MHFHPLRKLTYTWVLRLYFLSGVFVALLTNDWLSDTSVARTVGATFPVLNAISIGSVDPGSWLTYFTTMILLQVLFLPFAAIALAPEVKARPFAVFPLQILTAALVFLLLWFCLVGATSLFGDPNTLHISLHGRGAALATFLLNSRLGLALIGSLYMSCSFVFFSLGVIALPIAMYKSLAGDM